MTTTEQARAHLEAGRYREAHAAASEALAGASDDAELLRIAGRAGVELGSSDAVDQLTRVTELQPDSAEAWRELGDALLAEGRDKEAADAIDYANASPDVALTSLGHTEYAAGTEGAVARLEQAAERGGAMSTAAISLVEM